mgnify:CR=1 FL=1
MDIKTNYTLIGDVREKLKELPDKSIQMCVTSPPYYALRDYGTAEWEGGDPNCNHIKPTGSIKFAGRDTTAHDTMQYKKICKKCGAKRKDNQLGLEDTPEEFVENLVEVFAEVHRVLRDDGTLWLNLGDSYLKNKQLGFIPQKVAIALQEWGWILRQDIIWHKPNPMPESVKDRCTKAHEYIFLLSKNPKYYFDNDAIKDNCVSKNKQTNTKNTYGKYKSKENEAKNRQGIHSNRGDKLIKVRTKLPLQKDLVNFLRNKTNAKTLSNNTNIPLTKIEHWFRYDKTGFAYPTIEDWNKVKEFIDDWSDEFRLIDESLTYYELKTDEVIHLNKKNKRSVWTIPTKSYKEAHFAVFPPELAETCIKAGSNENDIVLDCFMGSGTTAMVAQDLFRKWIGVELNPEYEKLIRKRTAQQVLF